MTRTPYAPYCTANPAQAPASRSFEIITVIVLLASVFVPLVAGLVGIGMAWTSKVWTTRDKAVATLVSALVGLCGVVLIASVGIIGPIEFLFVLPLLTNTVGTAIAGIFLAVRLRGC